MSRKAKDKESVTFLASFPHRGGAVDFHGESGIRIMLDIPDTYKAQALMLPAYFLNKVLQVTLTVK